MQITSMITERSHYPILLSGLLTVSEKERQAKLRNLCRTDLFFLLVYGCKRVDADNDWVFARCREVQNEPDGFLDLWAREHYKSTIVTFALTLQNILVNPEITCGFFSHTRPIAKQFLRQIKQECEQNEDLKRWFPDVLWESPKKESPKWSEDDGLVFKRKGNPKESTVEAWGLIDGQPTSKHYKLMVYDDIVTRESVTTAEMIKKVTAGWELSRNLVSEGGKTRYVGTRYHFRDTYYAMMERGIKARIYAATVDGTADGEPRFMSRERLRNKRIEMQDTFAAQMLLQPRLDRDAYFKKEHIRYYRKHELPKHLRKYGASDYAVTSGGGDWTVHGIGGVDQNDDLYILDWWRGQTDSHVWINEFLRLANVHKPLMWGEENGQILKSLGPFIDKRMREERIYVNREPFTSASDKPTRGRSFQARLSMGKVLFPHPDDAPWVDDLMTEILMFPHTDHDDQVDVLGLLGRMLDKMVGGRAPKQDSMQRPDRWSEAFKRNSNEGADSWKTL